MVAHASCDSTAERHIGGDRRARPVRMAADFASVSETVLQKPDRRGFVRSPGYTGPERRRLPDRREEEAKPRQVTLVEARADLKRLVTQVVDENSVIEIIRRRGPGAVLVSALLWRQIEETLAAFDRPEDPLRMIERMAGFYADQLDLAAEGETRVVEHVPRKKDAA